MAGRTAAEDSRWHDFCAAWLTIGLLATLVSWGGGGLIGWPTEDECRADLEKMLR